MNQKGFSLVEVMIIIVIIGILMLVSFTAHRTHLMKGRDATRKADLKRVQSAFEDYYNDHDRYPPTFNCGDSFHPYLTHVPCNPSGLEYKYLVDPKSQWYKIYTNLEYEHDPTLEQSECREGCLIEGETYNYGVSSPNVSL